MRFHTSTRWRASWVAPWLFLLCGGLYGGADVQRSAGAPAREEVRTGRTAIFVRHAEKDAGADPRDPGLAGAGVRRAEALARMLEHAGVTHLYSSEFKRSRETLAPLSARVGHEVRVVPGADPARLVSQLRELPDGSVAVIAGHSNTVPDLVTRLGGRSSALSEDQYDRMFVLQLPPHGLESTLGVQTLELRYGD
jgi:phosphohistidine phosphatase SixA